MEAAFDPNRGTWLYILYVECVSLADAGADLAGQEVMCCWYNGSDIGGYSQPFTLTSGEYASVANYSYFVISHPSLEEREHRLTLTISKPDGEYLAYAYPDVSTFSTDDNFKPEDIEMQNETSGTVAVLRFYTIAQERWVYSPAEVHPSAEGYFLDPASDHQAAGLHSHFTGQQVDVVAQAEEPAAAPAEEVLAETPAVEAAQEEAHHQSGQSEQDRQAAKEAEEAAAREAEAREAQRRKAQEQERAKQEESRKRQEEQQAADDHAQSSRQKQWEKDRASLRREVFKEQERLREARERQRQSMLDSILSDIKSNRDKDGRDHANGRPRLDDSDSDFARRTSKHDSKSGPHVASQQSTPAGQRGSHRPSPKGAGVYTLDDGQHEPQLAGDAAASALARTTPRASERRHSAASHRQEELDRRVTPTARPREESDSDASGSCDFDDAEGGDAAMESGGLSQSSRGGWTAPARRQRREEAPAPAWPSQAQHARARSGGPGERRATPKIASTTPARNPRSQSARHAPTAPARSPTGGAAGGRPRPSQLGASTAPRSSSEVLAAALTDLKDISLPGFDNVAAVEESVLRLLALKREFASRAPGSDLEKAASGLAPRMLQILDAARGVCEENHHKFRALCEERNLPFEEVEGDNGYMDSQMGAIRRLSEQYSALREPGTRAPGPARWDHTTTTVHGRSPTGTAPMSTAMSARLSYGADGVSPRRAAHDSQFTGSEGATPRPLDPGAAGPQCPILRSGTSPRQPPSARSAQPSDWSGPPPARSARGEPGSSFQRDPPHHRDAWSGSGPSARFDWPGEWQAHESYGHDRHGHPPQHHSQPRTSVYTAAGRDPHRPRDLGAERYDHWDRPMHSARGAEPRAHYGSARQASPCGGRGGPEHSPQAHRQVETPLRAAMQQLRDVNQVLHRQQESARPTAHGGSSPSRGVPSSRGAWEADSHRSPPPAATPPEDKYLKILQSLQVKREKGNNLAAHILESSGLTPRRSGDADACRHPNNGVSAARSKHQGADGYERRRGHR